MTYDRKTERKWEQMYGPDPAQSGTNQSGSTSGGGTSNGGGAGGSSGGGNHAPRVCGSPNHAR